MNPGRPDSKYRQKRTKQARTEADIFNRDAGRFRRWWTSIEIWYTVRTGGRTIQYQTSSKGWKRD